MFVPRALRLKGVCEKPQSKPSKPPEAPAPQVNHDDALVEAMQKTSTSDPAGQLDKIDSKAIEHGPRFTTKPVTPEYVAQLAAGVELIFTDYAHHEEKRAKWLQDHYRTVDGEEKYVHLTAILNHPNISTLKPEASQALLQKALTEYPSKILEVSSNGYNIRRKPSSYPPKYLPHNPFDVTDDDGLAYWDQRTIYVEPHLRNICPTPAKIAHWLLEHGQLRPKWLPIQAVHTLWNSCAFVVLSGNVMHADVWQKWREADTPQDWKIMTKVEHTRRTAEYVALLEQQNPRGMRRNVMEESELPPIARPAVLPMAMDVAPEYAEAVGQGKKKRKRQKQKRKKTGHSVDHGDDDANADDDAVEGAEQDDEPSSKRRG